MYLDKCIRTVGNKKYKRVLLRESYRDKVSGKVLKKTIANISDCSDEEIEAIEFALKNKHNLKSIMPLSAGEVTQGKSVGAVALLFKVARTVGITGALRKGDEGKLALWLVLTRLINQGSRLSAVRLTTTHAAREILKLPWFDENSLYSTLDWLNDNQEKIEKRLFDRWQKGRKKSENITIFLYDVSSSYLEGANNALAEYGYNRDKKKGKKQIVFGLLTGEDGEPLSIEAFKGNTKDNGTLKFQLHKLKEKFKCKHITVVGDKGMIKSGEIQELQEIGYNFITTITKPQILKMIKENKFQASYFSNQLCEVKDEEAGIRYFLRRNPVREEQVKTTRLSKISRLQSAVKKANDYLLDHPKAKATTQENKLNTIIKNLKLSSFIILNSDAKSKQFSVVIDKENLAQDSLLDGCYVVKTDLPKDKASNKRAHDRYKALAEVEWAFRTMKTGYLEVRPIYLRNEERTKGHLFVCMLAYKIEKYLRKSWKDMNLTVEEGIKSLSLLTSSIVKVGSKKAHVIPEPNTLCKELIMKAGVTLPKSIPFMENSVDTKVKLPSRRK